MRPGCIFSDFVPRQCAFNVKAYLDILFMSSYSVLSTEYSAFNQGQENRKTDDSVLFAVIFNSTCRSIDP